MVLKWLPKIINVIHTGGTQNLQKTTKYIFFKFIKSFIEYDSKVVRECQRS